MKVYEMVTDREYKTISRWIKIHFNSKGIPYFRWKNRRFYFDCDIQNLSYPVMYYIKQPGNIDGIISSFIYTGAFIYNYVEIDSNNEYIRIYERIGN